MYQYFTEYLTKEACIFLNVKMRINGETLHIKCKN